VVRRGATSKRRDGRVEGSRASGLTIFFAGASVLGLGSWVLDMVQELAKDRLKVRGLMRRVDSRKDMQARVKGGRKERRCEMG
jgi:hypothetical protein